MASEQATVNADTEFNAPDADFILRSSDGVDFAVHRVILRLVSPVFNDMLSLPPQPSADPTTLLPFAELPDDAQSLRLLLRLCYPRSFCDAPGLLDLLDIKCAAYLADKYDVGFLRKKAERALVRYSKSSPSLAYAVAWRYGYEEALRVAARESLEVPEFYKSLTNAGDKIEFEAIPGTAVIHLMRYRDMVRAELDRMLLNSRDDPVAWIDPVHLDAQLLHGSSAGVEQMCTCASTDLWFQEEGMERPYQWRVYTWWWQYVYCVITSLQRERRPFGLDGVLKQSLFEGMRSALVCNSCNGAAVVSRVLEATQGRLRDTIQDRLRSIPLPLGIVAQE